MDGSTTFPPHPIFKATSAANPAATKLNKVHKILEEFAPALAKKMAAQGLDHDDLSPLERAKYKAAEYAVRMGDKFDMTDEMKAEQFDTRTKITPSKNQRKTAFAEIRRVFEAEYLEPIQKMIHQKWMTDVSHLRGVKPVYKDSIVDDTTMHAVRNTMVKVEQYIDHGALSDLRDTNEKIYKNFLYTAHQLTLEAKGNPIKADIVMAYRRAIDDPTLEIEEMAQRQMAKLTSKDLNIADQAIADIDDLAARIRQNMIMAAAEYGYNAPKKSEIKSAAMFIYKYMPNSRHLIKSIESGKTAGTDMPMVVDKNLAMTLNAVINHVNTSGRTPEEDLHFVHAQLQRLNLSRLNLAAYAVNKNQINAYKPAVRAEYDENPTIVPFRNKPRSANEDRPPKRSWGGLIKTRLKTAAMAALALVAPPATEYEAPNMTAGLETAHAGLVAVESSVLSVSEKTLDSAKPMSCGQYDPLTGQNYELQACKAAKLVHQGLPTPAVMVSAPDSIIQARDCDRDEKPCSIISDLGDESRQYIMEHNGYMPKFALSSKEFSVEIGYKMPTAPQDSRLQTPKPPIKKPSGVPVQDVAPIERSVNLKTLVTAKPAFAASAVIDNPTLDELTAAARNMRDALQLNGVDVSKDLGDHLNRLDSANNGYLWDIYAYSALFYMQQRGILNAQNPEVLTQAIAMLGLIGGNKTGEKAERNAETALKIWGLQAKLSSYKTAAFTPNS